MSDKLIMTFHITIEPSEISHMEGPSGQVTIIPFGGYVESELFTGTVRPGAADVQVTNASGIRHMCAKYLFEGTDAKGVPTKLFVENNGYFEPNSSPAPFHAYPIFITDNAELAPYLQQARFRAEGHGTDVGVDIRIFDVMG